MAPVYAEKLFELLRSSHTYLDVGEHGLQLLYLLCGAAVEREDGGEGGDLLRCDASFGQLVAHVVEAYLVEFVYGYGDVHQLVGRANHRGDTGQHLAVVDFDTHVDAQFTEHHVDHLHQFQFV